MFMRMSQAEVVSDLVGASVAKVVDEAGDIAPINESDESSPVRGSG
jgi:hypothetical protein